MIDYGENWQMANELLKGIQIHGVRIKQESFFVEPAYGFLLNKFNYTLNSKHYQSMLDLKQYKIRIPSQVPFKEQELLKKNPALYYWYYGIGNYFDKWLYNSSRTDMKTIEENFLKSIFVAAYTTEKIGIEMAARYMQASQIEDREKMLKGVIENLRNMSADKGSYDPGNGYNRRLVAAWSSFMYVNHEANKSNDVRVTKEGELMNKLIEVPLRELVPKLRGPPYYGVGR